MKKLMLVAIAITLSTALFAGGVTIEPTEPTAPITKQSNFYIGAGTAISPITQDWNTGYDKTAFVGILGYNFIQGTYSLAAEARGSMDFESLNTNTASLFLKPGYTYGDFTGYALVGGTIIKTDTFCSVKTYTYGGGLSYAITDTYSVFADYTRYDKARANDKTTIGVLYNF